MRLLYVLIFSLVLNGLLAQDVRQTVIFEDFNTTSISKVIRTLKNKYKVKFAYDDALISGLTINGSFNNVSIADFLDEILPPNGIDYRVLNGKIILVPKVIEADAATPTLFNFTLSGVVKDRLTGETLPNALVRVAGSSYGTVTNKDGRFLLPNVPTDTSSIEISYLGYKVSNEKLNPGDDKNSMQVEMKEHTTNLRGVTVESIPSETIKIGEGVGQMSLNSRRLTNLPSLGELDIFRSLQLMPGISGTDETSGDLSIRGSDPSQNLVLFDGFSLYRLDHFFGVFSAINADAVKDIQVFKSGFSPKYGGRTAAVVDITGKSGNRLKPQVEVGMNLLSARFSAQAPLANNRGSFIITGRRAFTDIIQSELYKKLINGVRENSTELESFSFIQEAAQNTEIIPDFSFYDVNAKFSLQMAPDELFSASFYKGNDNLRTENQRLFLDNARNIRVRDILDEQGDYGNEGFGMSWSKQWNRQYYSRFTLARSSFFEDYFYNFQFDLDDNGQNERFDYNLVKDNNIKESRFAFENEVFIDRENRVDFGLNVSKIEMSNNLTVNNDDNVSFADDGTVYGLYVNEKYTPNEQVIIEAGLRYTVTGLVLNNFLSPRLSVTLKPSESFSLKFSAGRYQQLIHEVVQDDPFVGRNTFWGLADGVNLPAIKSNNFAAGFNYSKRGWNIDVEYFDKKTEGLSQIIVSHLLEGRESVANIAFSQGSDKIRGIDVLLQQNNRNYSGWLAYTYMMAKNRFDFVNNEAEIFSAQDQRHEIKFVNMFSFRKFNFSATWIYGSGKPFLEPEVNVVRDNQNRIIDFEILNMNKTVKRLPVYNRVDVSAAYKFGTDDFGGEIGVSFLNFFGRENIRGRSLDIGVIEASRGRFRAPTNEELFRDLELLDFTPSFFFKIRF